MVAESVAGESDREDFSQMPDSKKKAVHRIAPLFSLPTGMSLSMLIPYLCSR